MAQRQTGESSVVISLAELLKLDEQRRAENADAERAREVEAQRRAAAAAERVRLEEEAKRIAAEERAREATLRAAMDDAHIEAAKAAQLEKARLEVQLRIAAEQNAARDAHARELAAIVERTREKRSPIALVFAVLAAVAAAVAITAVVITTQKSPEPVAVSTPVVRTANTTDQMLKEVEALKGELKRLQNQPPPATSVEPPKPKPVPPKQPVINTEPGKKVDCTGIAYCPGQ